MRPVRPRPLSERGAAAADLPPLREVIAQFDLGARKSLGQHFLLDLNITRRIAREAGPFDGETVLEIGPGPGGLTRALLESPAQAVIAIERDSRAIAALKILEDAYPERLKPVEGDALGILPSDLISEGDSLTIVANLPYNIAQKLLVGWLRDLAAIRSMTLMFQKEVADRLRASTGDKAYGRLSVITAWLCEIDTLFDLPPAAFVPPPKVTSTVVHLTPRAEPLAPADFRTLERVTSAAFGQRRKMLRSALRSLTTDPIALLESSGIDPTLRAENLSVEEFCALARACDRIDGAQ